MAILNEGIHDGEFLLSEGNGYLSRETVTFGPLGTDLPSGTLVGIVTATSKYAAYNDALSNGTQTAVGVLYHGLKASASDQKGVIIARLAEVASAKLTGSDANGVTDLAAKNIFVRT